MGLSYDLGEMKGEKGESLRYEVEAIASDMAIKLAESLREYPLYNHIIEKIPSPSTSLYFEKLIKTEIFPIARDICVLRWRRRNGVKISSREKIVRVPGKGISKLLLKTWDDDTICLEICNRSFKEHLYVLYRRCRSLARDALNWFWPIYYRYRYARIYREHRQGEGSIALQFIEGLDLQRRSDIIWYPESGIISERILIYFDSPDSKPIDENILKKIEALGMRWVCLDRRATIIKDLPVWSPVYCRGEKLTISDYSCRPKNEFERWIYRTGENLCHEVSKWMKFYRDFNVRIHILPGGSSLEQIVQRIALELKEPGKGIMAVKQRSELHWPSLSILGAYPCDVLFTWSPRAERYLTPNINRVLSIVSTGYPNDTVFDRKKTEAGNLTDLLKSRGVSYGVALFDNVHGPDIAYSTKSMEKFYYVFLDWLLEDTGVGIIIKSKKTAVIDNLPSIHPMLKKAEATGRCIRLQNEFGRMPADASLACDISVGIGISSAVIEAAIAGCRAVHLDFSCLRSHEFYRWGFDRIIFDDQNVLLSAMKKHKEGEASYLGDWNIHMDKLDPFRDGRAGERMGTYLRWCLEKFDDGLERNEVIRWTSKKYNGLWGDEKSAMLKQVL